MELTVGRIVHYYPDSREREEWSEQGNPIGKGEPLPAVVVQPWGDDCANLRVLLDGSGELPWVCSRARSESPQELHWVWPPRS